MHATHIMHALPNLRIAGGRLGDGFYHALQGLDCEDVNERDELRVVRERNRRLRRFYYLSSYENAQFE